MRKWPWTCARLVDYSAHFFVEGNHAAELHVPGQGGQVGVLYSPQGSNYPPEKMVGVGARGV